MNQFPYLYPHSLSEAERLNEEELWQDNRDAEVSHTQLTEMFRHSDPAALMDEAEQAQLAELDDTVTVYRGVTTINSDNLLALSWTLDYETADWFARRFDEDGTVYKAQIDKEHCVIFCKCRKRDVFGVNNKFYDAAMLVLKEAVNDKYDYISWWLYEGEPDYKVWSSDNTEEWNLTEPEALYDFIVNECQE